MKIDITNQSGGVKAFLSGFSTEELSAKIIACPTGQCDCECDPAVMEKITNIELSSEAGGATITVTGDVDAHTLEPMMKECLLGNND